MILQHRFVAINSYETYVKYMTHPEDKKISEIAEDELKHAHELRHAYVYDLMVVWSIVWMVLILVISVAVVIYFS